MIEFIAMWFLQMALQSSDSTNSGISWTFVLEIFQRRTERMWSDRLYIRRPYRPSAKTGSHRFPAQWRSSTTWRYPVVWNSSLFCLYNQSVEVSGRGLGCLDSSPKKSIPLQWIQTFFSGSGHKVRLQKGVSIASHIGILRGTNWKNIILCNKFSNISKLGANEIKMLNLYIKIKW